MMADNKTTTFDSLLDFLESIRQTCIDKSLPLTFDDENSQAVYMCSLYSIVVELAGDSCQGVKARKELASHVLARALLEAVVDLLNVIKNPKYVGIRFQKALIERRKKYVNLQQGDPKLISGAGHKAEYVEDLIGKIDKLRDTDIKQPNIKQRFKDAGMEGYYDTAYAILCDYTHHDSSAIINRHIGLNVRPLDDQGILMLSDLIAELLLRATIAVHDFLDSDQIEALKDLIPKWKTIYCQQAASVGSR
jgi:hypothetical protein